MILKDEHFEDELSQDSPKKYGFWIIDIDLI